MLGRTGRLTPEVARDVIATGVADVFAQTNREALGSSSIRAHFESWVRGKEIETAPSTYSRYRSVVSHFLGSLGNSAEKDVSLVRAAEISRFRDAQATSLSVSSANLAVKVIRSCLASAVRHGLLATNVASTVKTLKRRGAAARRDLTLSEIQRVLAVCDDVEWRGLILFGLYLGQRLGDLARLTWRMIDLDLAEVAFTTAKTGRRLVLPLMDPLLEYLESLPAADDPNAYIFLRAARATHTGTLSNQFRELLVSAGLVCARSHVGTGKGRGSARATCELSFHSLRHSAVTLLKTSGVSDALAREIVGHESAAISRQYTHVPVRELRKAMKRLPDVTKI